VPSGGYLATASVHTSAGGDSVLLARAVPSSFYVSGRGLVAGLADLGGSFSAAGS
jgi:hypothetical protein